MFSKTGCYDIVYADPPWPMWGSTTKNAAAGKHYDLMTLEEICSLPIKSLFQGKGALFVWATTPRLNLAIKAIESWGLHYRGVAYVWVKTRKDGGIINGQGVQPTFTKPTTEVLLSATTMPKGRPFPILDLKQGQVVLAPRGAHSEKPQIFRENLVQLCGDRPRIELFARQAVPGWDRWGLEAPAEISA